MENQGQAPKLSGITLEVNNHHVQAFKTLEGLWRQQILCDVILESDGCSVLGHRVVLASCSPYLNTLLTQQQMSSAAQVNIHFDNTSYNVLCCLIEFMYTGVLRILHCNINDVIQTAEEFGLQSVVDTCKQFVDNGQVHGANKWNEKASMFATVNHIINYVVGRAVNLSERKNKRQEKEMLESNTNANSDKNSPWHVSRVSGRKCSRPKRFMDSDSTFLKTTETNSLGSSEAYGVRSDNESDEDYSSEPGNKTDNSLGKENESDDSSEEEEMPETKRYHRQCNRCHKRFRSHNFLLRHRDTCTASQKDGNSVKYLHTKCRRCQTEFGDHTSLIQHRKTCHTERKSQIMKCRYNCDLCEYRHYAQKSVDLHRNAKHGVPFDESRYAILKCKDCSYQTIDRHRLQAHVTTHDTRRPFSCQTCGERFRQQNNLMVHNMRHENIKPYKCDFCGKSFRQKGTLSTHIDRIHHKKPRFLCSQCPFTAYLKTALQFHKYKTHGLPLPTGCKLFKCDLCEYVTNSSSQYASHSRRHTGEKPLQCGVCQKLFVDKNALREHMKWHTGDRKFKCTYEGCKQSCMSKNKLEEHVRLMHTHKGEKPWQCHMCSYRCAVKGNLTKHLRNIHRVNVITRQKRVQPIGKKTTEYTSGDAKSLPPVEQGKTQILVPGTTSMTEAVVVNILPNDISHFNGSGDFVTDEAMVAADIIALSQSAFSQAGNS